VARLEQRLKSPIIGQQGSGLRTELVEAAKRGAIKSMKWLPIAASLILISAPSVRAAAHKHHSKVHGSHKASHQAKSHHPHHSTHHASAYSNDSSRQVARPSRERDESPSLVAVRYARQTSPAAASSPNASGHHHHHKKKTHAHGVQLPKGPTPDRISEIQTALARSGYYQGDPTGKWDGDTIAAMQKFQSANGIDPTGKIDAPSLQKLGLGSDIAGVSAPKPLSPSTTTSTSSASHPASAVSSPALANAPAKSTVEASNASAGTTSGTNPQAGSTVAAPAADPPPGSGTH
jgi:hypothetical protein